MSLERSLLSTILTKERAKFCTRPRFMDAPKMASGSVDLQGMGQRWAAYAHMDQRKAGEELDYGFFIKPMRSQEQPDDMEFYYRDTKRSILDLGKGTGVNKLGGVL